MDYIADILISEDGYTYKPVTEGEARQWIEDHPSALDMIHDENEWNRGEISRLLRIQRRIELNKSPLTMKPGEEALVIRKQPVSDSKEIYAATGELKSNVTAPWEYGILKRII